MSLDNDGVEAGSDRILSLIKRRGPQRIADIALSLGITGEAARQQVTRLERLNLVRAESQRPNVGRPARAWALTDAGHARFPDRHAELTLGLLDAVRDEFGQAAIDRLIARRDVEMRDAYTTALAPLKGTANRVTALAAIRSREGYMAEAEPELTLGGWLLIENHCPICAAATRCQGFCRSELDVFRAALGDDVIVERTEHLLAGARRCAYRITEVQPQRGAPARAPRRARAGRTSTPRSID
jgi:predicted ArsR family transcriptional regulator